jgi:hypothetical protein
MLAFGVAKYQTKNRHRLVIDNNNHNQRQFHCIPAIFDRGRTVERVFYYSQEPSLQCQLLPFDVSCQQ